MLLGILGGGQLGLMLARAARDLGIESVVVDPKPDAVAGRIARHLALDWSAPEALDVLAACDVVTYEFENVPTAAVEALRARVTVHPAPAALAISGDRIVEKTLFRDLGVETAPFAQVDSRADLDDALDRIGLPAILKTRRFGYDGKGQALLRTAADVDTAWERLGERPLVLEGYVAFEREVSVIGVRTAAGETRFWPATENEHVDGILHLSRAPADGLPEATFASGRRALGAVMTKLDYVGVLVVEFFQVGDRLVANEMACRVHNSGHWTIEGAATSQFENHVRAVAGLPLGATEAKGFAGMVNLVGEVPSLDALEGDPTIHVHLYGKAPAPGRKLGHVTIVAETRDACEAGIRRVLDVVGDRADRRR
jgi:5-(carboxyamino)imidazole ribonucleotide synthase